MALAETVSDRFKAHFEVLLPSLQCTIAAFTVLFLSHNDEDYYKFDYSDEGHKSRSNTVAIGTYSEMTQSQML